MAIATRHVTDHVGRLSRILTSNNRIVHLQTNNLSRTKDKNSRTGVRNLQPAATIRRKVLRLNPLTRHNNTDK